jgi:hypothetical protein
MNMTFGKAVKPCEDCLNGFCTMNCSSQYPPPPPEGPGVRVVRDGSEKVKQELPGGMRFDVQQANYPQIGDVYPGKGGRGGRRYWVVVAARNRMLWCLGLDEGGNVVSAGGYGDHAFQRRELLGRVKDFENMVLKVEWMK